MPVGWEVIGCPLLVAVAAVMWTVVVMKVCRRELGEYGEALSRGQASGVAAPDPRGVGGKGSCGVDRSNGEGGT